MEIPLQFWMMRLMGACAQNQLPGWIFFFVFCVNSSNTENISVFFLGSEGKYLEKIRRSWVWISLTKSQVWNPLPFGPLNRRWHIIQRFMKVELKSCLCHWDVLNKVLDRSKQKAKSGGHDWIGGVFPILAGVYKGALMDAWIRGFKWFYRLIDRRDCVVDIVKTIPLLFG